MRLLTIPLLLLLTACTVDLGRERLHDTAVALRAADAVQVQRRATWRLPAATGVYVAVADDLPADAGDAALLVARRSALALRTGFVHVAEGARPEDLASALASARRHGADVTVYPRLLGSEPAQPLWRATGAEGPAFVAPVRQVQLAWLLLDTASGRLLDQVVIDQQAAWWPLPADADRLLDPAVAAAAAALVAPGTAG